MCGERGTVPGRGAREEEERRGRSRSGVHCPMWNVGPPHLLAYGAFDKPDMLRPRAPGWCGRAAVRAVKARVVENKVR